MADITQIKNAVCIITAICLAAGFVACGSVDDNKSNKKPRASEAVTSESMTQTTVTTVASATASAAIKEGIPEMTCDHINFADGSMIFANSQGGYTLINSNSEKINSVTVTDDDKRDVTIISSGNSLMLQISGQSIDYFVYQGHTVELTDGKLYYDKSPVEYRDTSFSEYAFSDKYTIVCTDTGKYTVKKSGGKTTDEFKIKDDNGTELIIYADENGFMAVNSDDLMEPAFKLNGDLITTSDGRIYINGKQLVPAGSNDITVKTTTTTTTSVTTTTKKTTTTTKKTTVQSQQDEPDNEQEQEPYYPPETQPQPEPEPEPQPEPEPEPEKPSNANISDITREMLGYVNELRSQYGLSELYGLEELDSVAQTRANELLESYSHTRPDGRGFDTAIDDAGLEWWHNAENIAYGANSEGYYTMSTAKEAFDAWVNSPDHREAILNPKLKYMAVATSRAETENGYEIYWEQIFFNDEYVP